MQKNGFCTLHDESQKPFQSKKLNWDWLAALNTEWFGKAFGGQKCIDNDGYVIPKFGYDLEVSRR